MQIQKKVMIKQLQKNLVMKYKMKKLKITGKTKIMTILEKRPECVEILFDAGLTCLGCVFAKQETLEQGLKAHGFTKKEINDLIKKLEKC